MHLQNKQLTVATDTGNKQLPLVHSFLCHYTPTLTHFLLFVMFFFPPAPQLSCVISCLHGSLSQQLAFDKTNGLQSKNGVTHRLYLALDLTSRPTYSSIQPFFSKSTSSFHCYFLCLLLPSLDNGLIPNKLATHLCTTLFKPYISTSKNLTVSCSANTQLPQPYLIG